MGDPVLRHADTDHAAQRLVGRPHQVLPPGVVVALVEGIGQGLERLHHRFGVTVLHQRPDRIGQVLLANMNKGIDDAVFQLAIRQAGHDLRIEDGEARPGRRHVEDLFLLRRPLGHHGPDIRLRAGRRQGQHDADRQRLPGNMLAADDVPTIAVIERSAGNELGAIGYRTATDAENEIDALLAHQRHGLFQRFQRRVRFDPRELDDPAPRQRLRDLLVDAIALDRAATVEQQDPGLGRNQLTQLGEAVGAENDLGRVAVVEVEQMGHRGVPQKG